MQSVWLRKGNCGSSRALLLVADPRIRMLRSFPQGLCLKKSLRLGMLRVPSVSDRGRCVLLVYSKAHGHGHG